MEKLFHNFGLPNILKKIKYCTIRQVIVVLKAFVSKNDFSDIYSKTLFNYLTTSFSQGLKQLQHKN